MDDKLNGLIDDYSGMGYIRSYLPRVSIAGGFRLGGETNLFISDGLWPPKGKYLRLLYYFTKTLHVHRRLPHGGVPVDVPYGPKNAKISLFPIQPHIITPFPIQGGETTYLSEPHLLSYLLSSQSPKNMRKFTFSEIRGYPELRRTPSRLPQGSYR